MNVSDIINNTTIPVIELHLVCIFLIVILYKNTRASFSRSARSQNASITFIYLGSALMILCDCIWTCVSNLNNINDVVAYVVNIVYFIGSSSASVCWFIFCSVQLARDSRKLKPIRIIFMLIYDVMLLLYVLSPWFGFIFSIKNGVYIRGTFFYLDPIVKMGYVLASSTLAIIVASKKEIKYLRNKDLYYVLFGLPVVVCGVIQTLTGADFNCLGVTLGLLLIYLTGITNPDVENKDAIYSLANSFEASYIVDMNTGLIRPLRDDIMHDKSAPSMRSKDFKTHFHGVLSSILLPEDRDDTLKTFDIQYIEKRFEIDNSFNIRYRVKESSGKSAIHMATFIRAFSNKGKQEFLLGINTIHPDSLLYERNESLSRENQKLEAINAGIIESVAKMVETRDSGSGEHVVRVRKLSEIIARQVMIDYPEYKLDDQMVKLISSASVLHDVGKIVIPDAVLLKPGKLTEDEFEIMKTHTTRGCDILNMFPLGLDDAFLECALSICRWHHEKYDGKGYPDGLKGEDIPIAAQIVSLADCYDALTSDRPYKKAFSSDVAFEMIVNGECGSFSPKIIHCLQAKKDELASLAKLYQ